MPPSVDSTSAGVCRSPRLSTRDEQVLRALARGLSNDGIAEELHLSVRTVRNYVSRCYVKLGVSTRVEAALWALQHLDSRPPDPDGDRR